MKTISSQEVSLWMDTLASGLTTITTAETCMIGIMTGGVTVAEKLHKQLGLETALGQLNISFYRDDFSRIGLHPVVGASELPFSVEGMHIVLVDDVLHTGRTIRAALNEIFDYGRPASITLAVLMERQGRELPIQADVIGKLVSLEDDEQIKLNTETMECLIGKSSELQ